MRILQFSTKTDIASLVLRSSTGLMFLLHGLGKPLVVGLDNVSTSFTALGFPTWTLYFSMIIEIVGGLMLILGLYSRVATLLLLTVSIGILIAHWPNGWVFHNPGGGWEFPQFIIMSLVAIFFLGTGKYGLKKLS